MRNLKMKSCQRYLTGLENVKFHLFTSMDYMDAVKGSKRFLVTDKDIYKFIVVGQCEMSLELILEMPDIVGAEFLILENSICLATAMGEVLTITEPENETSDEGYHVEEMIVCDKGIRKMCWSPDQEIMLLITTDHKVATMTCTYDLINEYDLKNPDGDGAGKFVSVGWGRKETQFHGSEGKEAARRKQNVAQIGDINKLPQDVNISWRADGVNYGVSYVCPKRGRTLKIFSKEGNWQYSVDIQPGLFPSIAWRPAGKWIAMGQKLSNKSRIVLFERNGLFNNFFTLQIDLDEEPIVDIQWSSGSAVLSLQTQYNIYLYAIRNYHWYLKQVLSFEEKCPVQLSFWDTRMDEEYTFHVLLKDGQYFVYKWYWTIDSLNHNTNALVSVIDGKFLLLTDFSKSAVPPPMSEQNINCGDYINAVTMASFNDELRIFIYDYKHCIHLYYCSSLYERLDFFRSGGSYFYYYPKDNVKLLPGFIASLQALNNSRSMYLFTNYLNVDNHNNSQSALGCIELVDHRIRTCTTYGVKVLPLNLNGCINFMRCAIKNEFDRYLEIFYHIENEKEIQYCLLNLDNNEIKEHRSYMELSQEIDQMDIIKGDDDELSPVILTKNKCLFVHGKQVATDVTSFNISNDYVLFTRLKKLCFFQLKNDSLINERRMECGGSLIITIAQMARSVLQLPRGNLEIVSPRIICLDLIGTYLDQYQYRAAFELIRKQRINSNIICDHNLSEFIQHLETFIIQIDDLNWLNLFINDLQNEDCTTTMYASNYLTDGRNSRMKNEIFLVDPLQDKVQFICNALITKMKEIDADYYRLPIITTFVKLEQTEKALELIWNLKTKLLREQRLNGRVKMDVIDDAERELKYLMYLVDINKLFNIALGSYDFGLVMFVAQKSKKDPKEYLAFLDQLQNYDKDYRCFKIDEYLKRWKKALHHIARCGKSKLDEALQFIKRRKCYTEALKTYQHDQECYTAVCLAFADHLRENSQLEEASLLYERGGNLQQALLSSKHILDWRRVLRLTAKTKGPEELLETAMSLVQDLKNQRKFKECYELAKNYCKMDFSNLLDILIEWENFELAIHETEMQKINGNVSEEEHELMGALIREKTLSHRIDLMRSLTADKRQFLEYRNRLREIRSNFGLQHEEGQRFGVNIGDGLEDNDMISETTSVVSTRASSTATKTTQKTLRSSKNRRKRERKLLSLKRGSAYEDIALINELHKKIIFCFEQQASVRAACKALLMLNEDSAATELQDLYEDLLSLMESSINEIWTPDVTFTNITVEDINEYDNDHLCEEIMKAKRYDILEPFVRIKPKLNITKWKHEMLLCYYE